MKNGELPASSFLFSNEQEGIFSPFPPLFSFVLTLFFFAAVLKEEDGALLYLPLPFPPFLP